MSHTLKAVDRVESACTLHHKAHFQGFFGLLRGQNAPKMGSKMGSFHPLVHPKWSTMSFGKLRF